MTEAADLFGGDEFPVPESVQNINWGTTHTSVGTNSYIYDPNLRLDTPPAPAKPTGVWVTFEDVDGVGQVRNVQVHEDELTALRRAVNDGVTARFLEHGHDLQEVL